MIGIRIMATAFVLMMIVGVFVKCQGKWIGSPDQVATVYAAFPASLPPLSAQFWPSGGFDDHY